MGAVDRALIARFPSLLEASPLSFFRDFFFSLVMRLCSWQVSRGRLFPEVWLSLGWREEETFGVLASRDCSPLSLEAHLWPREGTMEKHHVGEEWLVLSVFCSAKGGGSAPREALLELCCHQAESLL